MAEDSRAIVPGSGANAVHRAGKAPRNRPGPCSDAAAWYFSVTFAATFPGAGGRSNDHAYPDAGFPAVADAVADANANANAAAVRVSAAVHVPAAVPHAAGAPEPATGHAPEPATGRRADPLDAYPSGSATVRAALAVARSLFEPVQVPAVETEGSQAEKGQRVQESSH